MGKINEKSVSKAQQRLMGQAYAYKKGSLKNKDLDPKYAEQIKNLSDSMTMKQLKDYASTKHIGLVDKVNDSKILSFRMFLENLNNNELYNYYLNMYKDNYKGDKLNLNVYSSIREDFVDLIIGEINKIKVPKHYSDLCKTDRSPENDYKMILESLGDNFKIWDLKLIFNTDIDKICLYNSIEDLYLSHLNEHSGLMDIFFYFLLPELGYSNENIELGGSGWLGIVGDDEETKREVFIRYSYGYHRTDYGKLMLKQADMSIEEFKKKGVGQLYEYIYEVFGSICLNAFYIKNNKKGLGNRLASILNNFFITEYIIKEDDRIIIFINEIVDDLNELVISLNIINMSNDDLIKSFKSQLDILDLNIVGNENYIIIRDDFS